ncbi:hypothetical protein ACLBYG_22040 [Methylobacterium sp. D53M]
MSRPPPLTDRQRVELAIPSYLTFTLIRARCFGPDPTLSPEEGKREVERQTAELERLCALACREPIQDLPVREHGKLARRIERVVNEAIKPWEGQPAIKIALTIYHFLRDLTDREVLVLWEGSAMGQTMDLLFPMFEHGFACERQDASAQKQARRLRGFLEDRGYFRDTGTAEVGVAAHG